MFTRIASVSLVALFAVACGGSPDGNTAPAAPAAEPEKHEAVTTPPPAADAGAPDAQPQHTVGCDGVLDSHKVIDACGVCGGDGSSCAPCKATTAHELVANGAFADFQLPAGSFGDAHTWLDGDAYKYIFPLCHRIVWKGVKFTCTGGKWELDQKASFTSDAMCFNDNEAQPGLTTGAN
jgi:hypothetical protein